MIEGNTNIAVKNLTIGYQAITVAQEINFSLLKGELCAIVGVNGIGKSTLLRTLGNMQPLLKGSISIQDKAIATVPSQAMAKRISVVLTENVASKNLTVVELIALGRQPYTNWIGTLSDADKDFVNDSIVAFELEELKHRKCYELSDGQLQRALIARAMAQDTPVILLDEPTTHLDLYHKVQILKLMQKLAHEHQKTILFSTHEIDLAIQLCDKILILDGKENPFATPRELIKKGAFTELFPNDMISFDAKTGSFKVNK